MADNLIFPIGFDLQKAVEEASQDWDKKYAKRLEQAIAKRPVRIKLEFEKLEDVKKRLAELKIQPITKETRSAIRELAKELQVLAKALEQVQKFSKTTQLGQRNFTNDVQMEKLRQANERLEIQKRRVALAEQKHAEAMQRSATASRQLSSEFQNQDGYISRLLKRMAVYAGYSMVTGFLTNVREVTAEFELQRISLGAIIQDQQKANQIFAEIKSFALTSPLKILDLTKYAKQVAAYGFAADRVFDVTKRLADISVGLGVDMGRLTLAVSQIKAATTLKASELRQLTETGLPMLDLLSKKLTETQGKLVSAADVMDLISKRAISYEMVEEILYDLTDAGGMFYNMQVKQSQTLFGMWSKLGDAAAIMYDQIGNTSSINEGMKSAIGTIELLMRNWKTTARVLDTISVALVVYVVGLKNAAIASKAVTLAEAQRLAVEKGHLVITPKVIAAIIGKGRALGLSIRLTNLHTAAMAREAAATNVLTRGFWKLTAAMLANPWVAAAAGIALVVTALIHFIGNTETAAERAEKLNNSVASLKNLEDTTKPLIETYNELSAKTERTAEEQKKLSDVTHELAKQYPGAITAVGNLGEEVELAADKMNKLYQAEKQARMNNTRYELEQTEEKIKETEAEIARLQGVLQKGTKSMTVGGGISGYVQTITVEMSDEDKGKVLQQIDNLLYGEDGQGGLHFLKESAQAAKDALEAALKGITIEELHIERFGAWKKTLTTFKEQVGDIQVRLFEDSTINQFGSLQEALKKTAEEYKKNIALVATYDETLKSASLTSEERAKIETERAEADAMANLAEKALKYYNAMSLLNTSTSGRGTKSDNRLQNLQEIERTLTSINKKYEELAKTEGNTAALEYVRKNYDSTLKYINKLGKQFNLNFAMPTDFKDLQSYRKAIQGVIEQLKMKGYEKTAIELELKIAEGNQAQLQKEIQAKLKDLADRISRTKTAKEFYEKILSTTGDYSLASKVAESIFGQNGSELRKALADQVRGMTGDIELPDGIISDDNVIDYKALRQFAEANKNELGKMYDELIKISNDAQRDLAKTYEGYLKDLEKAKTYADKRVELARTTAEKIRAINADIVAGNTDEKVGKEIIRGLQDREDKEAAKLEYEAFKDTPLYIQMFEDLEHASTSTLEMMKSRLEALKGVWGTALDPTQLKEIQSRMNEIDEQLRTRNPFKTLKESYQQYRDAVRDVSLQGAIENVGVARKEFFERSRDYGANSAQARAAEKELKAREKIIDIARKITAENNKGAKALDEAAQIANDNLKIARGHLELAKAEEIALRDKSTYEDPNKDPKVIAAYEAVEAAKEEVNLAERVAEITTENAKRAKTLKEAFVSAANQVTQFMQIGADVAQAIGDTMEALGANEEDVQYFNDIATALGDITAGFQGIIDSALSLNVGGIISNAIGVIPNMVKGFAGLFTAGKVKRANKEIKRQQEILEQLDYTYGRLEKAADKLFGVDYVQNYNRQMQVLQAQAIAYQKQAQAERSKGKDADEAKIKEYENAYRDTMDKIADMESDLTSHFLNTDRASAARDFANAWIDAKIAFGNTADAIKSKYKEMIKSMIVEGAAAKVIDRILAPMWDVMDEKLDKGDIYGAIDYLANGMEGFVEQADNGLNVLWKALEARGYDMKAMIGDIDSGYKGIAKNVANATSEEINANTAALNTQNYYMATLNANVALIRQLMERGTTSTLPDTTAAGWTDWQQQAMDNYNAIARNTADTVVECRRAAVACEAATKNLNRIIVAKGTVSGVNVFMKG